MKTWADLQTGRPELAEKARRLLYRTGSGEALLATVRGNEPPRIHPIAVEVVDGGLYAFILRSPKLVDLLEDGRYALHAYPDAAVPHEVQLRGIVRAVDPATRDRLAPRWPFGVGDARAFEFLIDELILGERDSRDAWPPRYTRWRAEDA
jgi:hypothetical protein